MEGLADRMSLIDPDLLSANKRIVNLGLEQMGARTLQRLAAETDARVRPSAAAQSAEAVGDRHSADRSANQFVADQLHQEQTTGMATRRPTALPRKAPRCTRTTQGWTAWRGGPTPCSPRSAAG